MATRYFTLHDFIKGAISRMVAKTAEGGHGYTNARITFEPGEIYKVDDDLLAKYLLGEVGDVRQKSVYTPELLEELKAHQVPYEVTKCGTCASAKPSLVYNPFKEVPAPKENE